MCLNQLGHLIVTGIESVVSQLLETQEDQLRCETSLLLDKMSTPNRNLMKQGNKAVSILGEND